MLRPSHLTSLFCALLFAAAAGCGGAAVKSDPAEPKALGEPAAEPATEPPAEPDPPAPTLKLGTTIVPTSYTGELKIDPGSDRFQGKLKIAVTAHQPTRYLWLNAEGLDIEVAKVAGADGAGFEPARKLSTASDHFVGFELPEGRRSGDMLVVIKWSGEIAQKGYSGAFMQEEGGHKYVYTQFEALGARKVFPSFDQPEFKTPWQLSITVPEGHGAFNNAPQVNKTEGSEGWTTFEFAQTKPIPSYLVAFAAGPFEVIDIGTGGRNNTPLRIIVPQGRTGEIDFARANKAAILAALEDYFDVPYPYAKLDSIALPHFFGAMENPGLITYASNILLVEPGTESQRFRERHMVVVTHEIAHQWFGNLVTLKWWNDIWLNESFSTWIAAKVVRQLRPSWDGQVRRVGDRDDAMGLDSSARVRKLRMTVKSTADIGNIFDQISYGKGAAVIEMFEAWIGDDAFRKGMRQYMTKHAWGSATAADFLAALAAVSEGDLPDAFATFLDQQGYPAFSAKLECSKGSAELRLEQSRYVPEGSKASADQTWSVPVCVKYGARGRSYSQCSLVTEKTATIDVSKGKRCPDWVLGNADARGYYRVSYEGDLLGRLLKNERALSTADRIGLIGDVEALLGAGKIEVGDALGLVPRLGRDKNHHIVVSAAGIASSIAPMVPQDMEKNYDRFLRKMFGKKARALGWGSPDEKSRATIELREAVVPLVALGSEDPALLAKATKLAEMWLIDRKAISPDMVGEVLQAAAHVGDAALYEKFLAAAKATTDRRDQGRLIGALGAFRDEKLTGRTLELLVGDEFGFQQLFSLLQPVLTDRERRQRGYDYIKQNFDTVAGKLPEMARGFMAFSAVPFCDEAHKKDAEAFFGAKLKGNTQAERILGQALDAIDTCMAQKKRRTAGVVKFLRKY